MLKFILIGLFINLIYCQEFPINTYINLLKTNSSYQNVYLSHLNDYLHYLDLILNDVNRNISFKCENDLLHLKKGLLDKEEFALNFYESNAKDNPGILTGFDGNLGNFDFCLKIRAKTDYDLEYKGKYCLISIQTELGNSVKKTEDYQKNLIGLSEEAKFLNEFNLGSIYGVCIPNSCQIKDLLNSINKVVNRYNFKIIGQNDDHCSSDDHVPYTKLEFICSILAGLLVLLCMLSFYFDDNKFINLFSVKNNFKKIYRIPSDYKSNESTNFIHGLKAIYGLLSAAVHATPVLYAFAPVLYGSAKNQIMDLDYFSKGLIARLLLGIDIAFFIGGFLAIVAWSVVFDQKRANFFLYTMSRFLRTVPIIISMLILDRIWPRFGNGPIYKQLTHHLEMNCERSFWKLFLFISNQDRAVDICQLPSWFISVDFQLYIFHYFLIKFLVQKPTIGIALAFIQMIAINIYSASDIFFNNLEPFFSSYNVYFYNTIRMEKQYFISTIHSNSYTIGVLCGYLVINRKKYNFFEKPFNRYMAFILSGISCFCSIYLPDLFGDNNLPKDNLVKSILLCVSATLFRPLYILLFVPIFYFMSIGYFKTGRKILGSEFFLPISRLSYTIIMSQFIYLWHNIGSRRDLFRLTMLNLFKEATFSLVISVLIGNIVFAFFECPIANLLTYFTGLDRKKTQLKQDCSTSKLNCEMQQELSKSQEFIKPKINVISCDENSNTIRATFEI